MSAFLKNFQFVWIGICLITGISFMACGAIETTEEQSQKLNYSLENPSLKNIFNLQEQQNLDSLLYFLQSEDVNLRYAAAKAFASFQSKDASKALAPYLKDTLTEIRSAVAYALGQIGDPENQNTLIQGIAYDDPEGRQESNAQILEAVGKTADESILKFLATATDGYTKDDPIAVLGRARGIYRFALRGLTVPEGTQLMASYAANPDFQTEVRVIAANYLLRAKDINVNPHLDLIQATLDNETNPNIRMALVIAMGKSKLKSAADYLINMLKSEEDYRVRNNIIRAFSNFDYKDVNAAVKDHLKDPQIQVANSAADYFVNKGNLNGALAYRSWSKESYPKSVKYKLYKAANKFLPDFYAITKNNINKELKTLFKTEPSKYIKKEILNAMTESPDNLNFIFNEAFKSKDPVLKSSAADAIGQMLKNTAIPKTMTRSSYANLKNRIFNYLKQMMASSDVGAQAIVASLFSDKENYFNGLIKSSSFLNAALEKLQLPRDVETYNEIVKAINLHNPEATIKTHTPTFNHPIDWELFDQLGAEPIATIHTERGIIKVKLFKEHAPGSVVNFVSLARDKYYDNKVFHRVVPNFVVQAGCSRGDGYGSLDYSIRSELNNAYYDDEGYIGMASAGLHTESTQWFITHSPTPHLDGRYTLFGKVVEGMDVVHALEIGDKINTINIAE